MIITGISVGGYKNIDLVTLNFSNKVSALIGFNNYGKSNVIEGICFGLRYIQANMINREQMMRDIKSKPLKAKLQDKPYSFAMQFKDAKHFYSYSLSFYWSTSKIVSEELTRDNEIIHYRNLNTQVVPDLGLLIDKKQSNLQLIYNFIKSASAYGADLITDLNSDTVIYKKHGLTLAHALYDLQNNDSSNFQLLIEAYTSLIPNISYLKTEKDNNVYTIIVKEEDINIETSFQNLSMGSRRLLALLYMALKAKDYQIQLLFFEEIEACLHPRLIPLLLMSLSKLATNSNIVLTSHSPYLIQHLPINSVYLATPTQHGIAGFKTINPSLQERLLRQAQDLEISLGVYLFDLLIDSFYDPDVLSEWL